MQYIQLILSLLALVILLPFCIFFIAVLLPVLKELGTLCLDVAHNKLERISNIFRKGIRRLVRTFALFREKMSSNFLRKEEVIKEQWERHKAEYIIVIKMTIILLCFLGYLAHITHVGVKYNWNEFTNGNHWLYVLLLLLELIVVVYFICNRYESSFEETYSELQNSFTYLENRIQDVKKCEVWLRMIYKKMNLLDSISNSFILMIFPCILGIEGYKILTGNAFGARELINISLAVTSVVIAIYSLAFAKDVKKESDAKNECMMEKLDNIQSIKGDSSRRDFVMIK